MKQSLPGRPPTPAGQHRPRLWPGPPGFTDYGGVRRSWRSKCPLMGLGAFVQLQYQGIDFFLGYKLQMETS